jgi:transcriptional regulator with XRE-family HTH domain
MAFATCEHWRIQHDQTMRLRQDRIVDFAMTTPDKPSEVFAERLQKSREIRGLSQSSLAEKAGLPASSISHFEAGSRKPSFENLRRIARALDVSTDFLLGRVDELVADSAAPADPLYRDLKNLTDQDRDLAREFMEMLANRRKKETDDGDR